jgi:hypothetical protein
VGHRADQRRAAEAEHRGQQSLDSTLALATTTTRTNSDLAHVPAQPCSPSLWSTTTRSVHIGRSDCRPLNSRCVRPEALSDRVHF